MLTRSKAGVFKPNPKYAMVTSTPPLSPLPKSAREALKDPNWRAAMQAEFDALMANRTWSLVDRPPHARVITGKWVFRIKLNTDGTLNRYKARWVVRGFHHRAGIDFTETFSPVVKPATIRTVLAIIASHGWSAHQLDVSNAFLHGNIEEQVFCQQPTGFADAAKPDAVCLLSRSLYGLRQAPRAWFNRFVTFILTLGFVQSKADPSLFVLRQGQATAYLLLYVDDIILSASTTTLHQAITSRLKSEFAIKDLGDLHFFLGVDVQRRKDGFHLSQAAYARDVLDRAGMSNCKPVSTPADTKAKTSSIDGPLFPDGSWYRSMAGALQYLTLTRPDMAYAIQQVSLHMHQPRECHAAMLKRILRYLKGTVDFGLHLHAATTPTMTAYTDADWAGCPDTRRSTSGFCIYIGDALVSWSSKRQNTVSRSSAEAEYRGVANAVAECSWLRHLLYELRHDIKQATIVYCDNVSAVYMCKNPVHHKRTKHIELDIHFVRERVAVGAVRVLHVPSDKQFADIFTKGLPSALHDDFRSSLCVGLDHR
jgi:hypothetical protein